MQMFMFILRFAVGLLCTRHLHPILLLGPSYASYDIQMGCTRDHVTTSTSPVHRSRRSQALIRKLRLRPTNATARFFMNQDPPDHNTPRSSRRKDCRRLDIGVWAFWISLSCFFCGQIVAHYVVPICAGA